MLKFGAGLVLLSVVAAACGAAATKTVTVTPTRAARPTRADVGTVLRALHSAGLDATREANHESAQASYVTAADSPWSIWVLKPGTVSTDEVLSGSGYEMNLSDKHRGPVYWTKFVPDSAIDPSLSHSTGSYTAFKLYGRNIVLEWRLNVRRGAPHRTAQTMPGGWIIVDETLKTLVGP
jgi:hypothetical protein